MSTTAPARPAAAPSPAPAAYPSTVLTVDRAQSLPKFRTTWQASAFVTHTCQGMIRNGTSSAQDLSNLVLSHLEVTAKMQADEDLHHHEYEAILGFIAKEHREKSAEAQHAQLLGTIVALLSRREDPKLAAYKLVEKITANRLAFLLPHIRETIGYFDLPFDDQNALFSRTIFYNFQNMPYFSGVIVKNPNRAPGQSNCFMISAYHDYRDKIRFNCAAESDDHTPVSGIDMLTQVTALCEANAAAVAAAPAPGAAAANTHVVTATGMAVIEMLSRHPESFGTGFMTSRVTPNGNANANAEAAAPAPGAAAAAANAIGRTGDAANVKK